MSIGYLKLLVSKKIKQLLVVMELGLEMFLSIQPTPPTFYRPTQDPLCSCVTLQLIIQVLFNYSVSPL